MANKNNQPFVFYSDQLQVNSFFDLKSNKQRYIIKGHITTGDLDLVNDIITNECLKDISSQFKARNIKLDFDHETLIGNNELEEKLGLTKIPLGKAVNEAKDEKGNFVEFELNPNWRKFDSKGNIVMDFRNVWDSIKGKYYDAFSIAFIPLKTAYKEVKGSKVRLLDKVNIINVALTGNPINPAATMTAVMAKSLKSFDSRKKEGEKMTEESKTKEKSADAGEGAKTEEPKTTETPGSEAQPAEPAAEGKSSKEEKIEESILELKTEIKSLKEENDSLKKELKSFVEKARPSSLGAESKSKVSEKSDTAPKLVGPLDMI